MGRYIRDIVLNKPNDFVAFMINDYLNKEGFKLVEFKGQQVFRCGGGLFEMPKFLVWNYQNGVFHMEAWVRICWLPGVYGKENEIKGFCGALPKQMYKQSLEELERLLQQPLPNDNNQGGVNMSENNNQGVNNLLNQGMQNQGMPNQGMYNQGMPNQGMPNQGMPNQGMYNQGMPNQGMPNQGMYNQGMPNQGMPNQGMYNQGSYFNQPPTYVQGVDTGRYAGLSLGFSIAGLLGLLIPILGVIFASLGITYSRKAAKGSKTGMATAAMVIGIITMAISIINWAAGIYIVLNR